jgi:hypothetical protein
MSIEKHNLSILMIGSNLQTGIQFAILRNFQTSLTLLVLSFTMLNNGKNGTCHLILKKSLYLDNGMKNAIA